MSLTCLNCGAAPNGHFCQMVWGATVPLAACYTGFVLVKVFGPGRVMWRTVTAIVLNLLATALCFGLPTVLYFLHLEQRHG